MNDQNKHLPFYVGLHHLKSPEHCWKHNLQYSWFIECQWDNLFQPLLYRTLFTNKLITHVWSKSTRVLLLQMTTPLCHHWIFLICTFSLSIGYIPHL